MPEIFPSTPRAPTVVRLCAVVLGLAGVVLATRATLTSSAWVGRTFPGFLLLVNRVVASIGLAHWSGSTVAELYQSQVVAVNGVPVASAQQVYSAVAASPPGTPVRYRLHKRSVEREITVPSQRFAARDWILLFGAYLLNGVVYLTSGLVVWILRPYSPLSRAFLSFGTAWAFFLITAMDIYGPGTLTRLHAVTEPLVAAATLQVFMLLPQPHRYARWRFIGYALALPLVVAYQALLYRPSAFSAVVMLNMLCLGSVGVFFVGRLIAEYWRGTSQLARQRVRVLTLGTLVSIGLPGTILLISSAVWGQVAMNPAAFMFFLFALFLAYAIVKHDLFELDAMVKRGAYYLVLSGAVAAAYIGAVVLLDVGLNGNAVTASPAFPVLFRTAYDGARELAAVGRQLASALQQERIVALVRSAVDHAIPNSATRLFVRAPDGRLAEAGGGRGVQPAPGRALAGGGIITVYDPDELYPDAATHEAVRAALTTLGAEVALPLRLRGELVGILTAGAKRTGLFYTAGDAEFLRALAQQAAIAR